MLKTIKAYTRKDGVRVAKHSKRIDKKQKLQKHIFERRKYNRGHFGWAERSDSW